MAIRRRSLLSSIFIMLLIAACGPSASSYIDRGFLSSQFSGTSNSALFSSSTSKVAVVTTVAGTTGTSGSSNGTGTQSTFNSPWGVAVDTSGNVYVAERGNHLIRKVTSGGVVTTLAGNAGSFGSSNGTGTQATFSYPAGVAVDSSGNVYVADNWIHRIRKITSDGVVTTVAGIAGTPGSSNGTGTQATFNYPKGVAVDSSGNIYVADTENHFIRKITFE